MTAQNPPTYPAGADASLRPSPQLAAQVLTQAFVWMFAGLLVTAVTAFAVQQSPDLMRLIGRNWLFAFLAQIGLALAIQGLIRRLNPIAALGLFFVFAISIGLTIGVVVSFYTGTSVATAFLSAASIFGAAALYGYTTGRPLVKFQQYIPIVLFGWIVAVVVNIVIGGGTFSIILSLITVALFTALTAYDVKRLQQGDYIAWTGGAERAAVLGAVHLYISFVNIFVSLLNLLGDRD
jgi:FtsH-binding integral membrane protein